MQKLSPTISILLLLFCTPLVSAQVLKTKGDREFTLLRYANAIEYYEEYLKKNNQDLGAKLKLAQSYKKVQDTKNAERVFRSIEPNQLGAEASLQFAEVLSQNGNYKEAEQWYAKLGKANPADDRAKKFTDAYQSINQFYFDSSRYKVYYLGFNSPQADFGPTYYKNGVVFSSGRLQEHGVRRVFSWDNSAFLDLFFADTLSMDTSQFITSRAQEKILTDQEKANVEMRKKTYYDDTPVTSNDTQTLGFYGNTFIEGVTGAAGKNTIVKNFSKDINSKYHESSATFTKDQNTVYFTRNNFLKGKYGQSETEINKLKIYVADKNTSGEWGSVREFPYNSNNVSMGHPALSPDNKTLYFVSDMPGGMGGTDLYKSIFENGAWGRPQNLGKPWNTEGNEMFPFVSEANQLFFASTGHGGLGGMDIFSGDLNAPRAEAANMGFPVNSKKDDFGLIVNAKGTKGFFSSNRKRGGTDDDLFMFTCQQESKLILFVYNSAGKDTVSRVPVVLYERGHEKEWLPGTANGKLTSFTVSRGKKYTALANADGTKVYKNVSTPDQYFSSMTVGVPLPNYYTDKKKYPPVPGDEGAVVVAKAGVANLQKREIGLNNLSKSKADSLLARRGKEATQAKGKEEMPTEKSASGQVLKPGILLTKEDCERYQKFSVPHIYYDLDKSIIRKDAVPVMQKVAGLIQENEGVEVLLSSHTDSRQTDAYNRKLSARRAEAAYQWLFSSKIRVRKLSKEWHGESHLTNDCGNGQRCTEADHALNRRTEFYFTVQGVDVTKQCESLKIVVGLSVSMKK
jgi:outer membrane protein OmpA-like peptidoglycan-associated protein/tetratricopeptide (TPR) repeat protein